MRESCSANVLSPRPCGSYGTRGVRSRARGCEWPVRQAAARGAAARSVRWAAVRRGVAARATARSAVRPAVIRAADVKLARGRLRAFSWSQFLYHFLLTENARARLLSGLTAATPRTLRTRAPVFPTEPLGTFSEAAPQALRSNTWISGPKCRQARAAQRLGGRSCLSAKISMCRDAPTAQDAPVGCAP